MQKVKNILVITTWAYRNGLIQSSTLPYLKMIHEVTPDSVMYLVTQEKEQWYKDKGERQKVNLQLKSHNVTLLPQQYYNFGLKKIAASVIQFGQLVWFILSKNISHVHAFCTPAGATGYVLSVLTGRKLIVDSYEPHAEAMVENGTWQKESVAFKLLWWLEKKQTQAAYYCLAVAKGMKQYAGEKYSVLIKNYGVRPMAVDLDLFRYNAVPAERIRLNLNWQDKIICVYAGKFGGIYLDKEVFSLFKAAFSYWGERFRVLLLTASTNDEIISYCKESSVPHHIFHWLKVPYQLVPDYLSVADFAITPVKPVPSKRYCAPIKDGEYWAVGLPVVITKNISDDSDIIEQHNIGAVLNGLNDESYLKSIQKIDQLLLEDKVLLRNRIRKIAETYRNYNIALSEYRKVYGTTAELENTQGLARSHKETSK